MSSNSPVRLDVRGVGRAALLAAWAGAVLLASGCGRYHGSAPGSGASYVPVAPKVVARPAGGGQSMALTVNGSTCGAGSYTNKPCVEVTVCEPGGSNCVAVGDILLDTGSYGLRIFSSALPLQLAPVIVGGRSLASCVQFADLSADWGPIRTADLYLGDAGPVTTGLQVIDATFGTVPAACGRPDTGPAQAGLNGILGVGPYLEDCGSGCATSSANGLYYGCIGLACPGVAVPRAQQVSNPAALLPGLGNGLVIDLPGVAAGGALSAAGNVTFGIGAGLSGVSAYPITLLSGLPTMGQKVNGTVGHGFLDTGSNALYFTPPPGTTLTTCKPPNTGFYCTAATLSVQFSTGGSNYSPAVAVGVASLDTLNGAYNVFNDLAGTLPGLGAYDWGLPFYLGRRIYQGQDGQVSSLGTGPFQAF